MGYLYPDEENWRRADALKRSGGVGAPAFSPLSLFALGEQGAWYDPSDFLTLFQDSAGTIPLTAVGEPVGLMLDKSGRGNHARQATNASRPTLTTDSGGRYCLRCDGTDDGMVTAGVNFSGTDKMTVWAGVRKETGTGFQCLLEMGSGDPAIFAPTSTNNDYGFWMKAASRNTVATIYVPPITNVLSVQHDTAATTAALQTAIRINATSAAHGGLLATAANFTNAPLYLFRRGGTSLPFNGLFYGTIIRGAASTAQQIAAVEAYLASKCGVTLP